VTIAEIEKQLEEMFDCALTYHGYTKYLRDYEMVVYQSVDPNPKYGLVPRHLRFVFRICPEAFVTSRVRPDVWSRSLDDALIDEHVVTMESKGFVWGVNCQVLYPGAKVVPDSPRAAEWSENIGIPFYEARVVGNTQEITVIFAELVVEDVDAGYSPYQVEELGAPERYESHVKIPLTPSDEH
jgi:hypothetical protein